MTKPIYQFKDGAHLKGDAQPVGERLDALRQRHEGLTPEQVLQDATAPSSVLHDYFEWDDSKAAQRFRLDQAGHLIRSVTVTMVEPEGANDTLPMVEAKTTVGIRAFVAVQRPSGQRIYESTATALSDVEYRRQVLGRAHSELTAIRSKYSELEELAQVFQAVDHVGRLLGTERLAEQG